MRPGSLHSRPVCASNVLLPRYGQTSCHQGQVSGHAGLARPLGELVAVCRHERHARNPYQRPRVDMEYVPDLHGTPPSGATLSRLSGIPWVADFRDPMVSNYPSTGLQRTLWKRLESYVLRHAAACIFTTERAAITYRQRYPMAQARCHVIENGYDEDAFNGVEPDRFGAPANKLLILHSGLIYPQDRNHLLFSLQLIVCCRKK